MASTVTVHEYKIDGSRHDKYLIVGDSMTGKTTTAKKIIHELGSGCCRFVFTETVGEWTHSYNISDFSEIYGKWERLGKASRGQNQRPRSVFVFDCIPWDGLEKDRDFQSLMINGRHIGASVIIIYQTNITDEKVYKKYTPVFNPMMRMQFCHCILLQTNSEVEVRGLWIKYFQEIGSLSYFQQLCSATTNGLVLNRIDNTIYFLPKNEKVDLDPCPLEKLAT